MKMIIDKKVLDFIEASGCKFITKSGEYINFPYYLKCTEGEESVELLLFQDLPEEMKEIIQKNALCIVKILNKIL